MLDPVNAGLVTSLARPGGNLTGITLDAGIEIWEKRLQMLKEAMPSTVKAAFLGMRGGWEDPSAQVVRDAADRLGISLVLMLPEKGTPSEIERVFAAMEQQRPDAVLVSGEGDLYANRQLIAELAEKNRLPVMCPYRDYVEAGGLMAYAVDLAELLRRMADNVHQILKGAKPGKSRFISDQVRTPDQPKDCESARPHPTAGAACPRGRGDRMKCGMSAISPKQ